MTFLSHPLWFTIGALSVAGVGLRYLLRRGLTPEVALGGPQPGDFGLPAHEVHIESVRGKKLFAWYIPANTSAPVPAVVLLHGWGGNANALLPAASTLHRAGYTVLLPEARNHGRSERDGHSSLPRFAQDLESAVGWLARQPTTDTARIAVVGHSVGAAAALLSASRRRDYCAVVSVAAFAHPESIMRRWLRSRQIPYWPIGWLINRYVEWVIGARFNEIAPVSTLPKVACPVMLVHGRQDSTVPLEDGWRLLRSRADGKVSLLELDGTHETFADMESASQQLSAFLGRAFRAA